ADLKASGSPGQVLVVIHGGLALHGDGVDRHTNNRADVLGLADHANHLVTRQLCQTLDLVNAGDQLQNLAEGLQVASGNAGALEVGPDLRRDVHGHVTLGISQRVQDSNESGANVVIEIGRAHV